MAKILRVLFTPREEYGFLKNVIFHNTCINFGLKVRLLTHIAETRKWNEIKMGHFNDLIALRNAFAHTSTDKYQILVSTDPETNKVVSFERQMLVERKLNNSWESIDRDKAFSRFIELHGKCSTTLYTFMQRITDDIGVRFVSVEFSLQKSKRSLDEV